MRCRWCTTISKSSWPGYFRCESRGEWCGTREDSPGRSGLWASSSGCSLSNTSKIQVSEWSPCTIKEFFSQRKYASAGHLCTSVIWVFTFNTLCMGVYFLAVCRSSGLGCPGTSMDSPKGVDRTRAAKHSAQWPGHPRPWCRWTGQPWRLPGRPSIWQNVAARYNFNPWIKASFSISLLFFWQWKLYSNRSVHSILTYYHLLDWRDLVVSHVYKLR